jgi:hypothetical protein
LVTYSPTTDSQLLLLLLQGSPPFLELQIFLLPSEAH